jgi:hypothetical protein
MVEKNSSQATIKDFVDGGGSALRDFEGGPKTDDWKSNPWRKDLIPTLAKLIRSKKES